MTLKGQNQGRRFLDWHIAQTTHFRPVICIIDRKEIVYGLSVGAITFNLDDLEGSNSRSVMRVSTGVELCWHGYQGQLYPSTEGPLILVNSWFNLL